MENGGDRVYRKACPVGETAEPSPCRARGLLKPGLEARLGCDVQD